MSIYNPDMWIMKITPGGSGNTKMFFENLFIKEGCKNLIGYTKEDGEIEKFSNRWHKIKIGDLIVVIEGYNRVFGVVEITSDPFDDENEEGDKQADWFYHRRKAELVKYFNPSFEAKANTNRDTIIEYSGDGAIEICDEVWDKIKEEYITHKKSKQMQQKIDILKYKKQIILQGPPGTGKTRLAQLMADEIIKSEVKLTPLQYVDWYIKTFKSTKDLNERNAQRISLLNEFVTAFPIVNIPNLTLDTYSLGRGSQDSFCYWLEKKLGSLGRFSPGLAGTTVYGVYFSHEQNAFVSTDKTPQQKLDDIKSALNTLLTTQNYTDAAAIFRKSFILKILSTYFPNEYFPIFSQNHLKLIAKIFEINTNGLDDIQLNKKINEKFLEMKANHSSSISNFDFMGHLYDKFKIKNDDVNLDDVQVLDTLGEKKLIQFHPAYTYEDFVRGITADTNTKGQVEYKVENKTLAEFAQKALDNQAINYVLIIDEINRANLPSVLGELIYALEYRYNPDKPKENVVESMYSLKQEGIEGTGDRALRLPNNLFIIGTMNTADRSVGHIDYAIKRRFAFIDVPPTDVAIDEVIDDADLNRKAKALYADVSKLFNEEKTADKPAYLQSDFKAKDVQLGHSYFLVDSLSELNMKLEFEIKPILFEYVKDGVLSQEAEKEIKALKVNE
jgi:5-methylcytosine-specific restriction protein B